MAASTSPFKTSGQRDWSGGVNSSKTPTIASDLNPNGLSRNQLAWLINGTVRDGTIQPRDGWQSKGVIVGAGSLPYLIGSTFQGETNYVPTTGNPYKICVIGGHVIKVDPDFNSPPVDLTEIYGFGFLSTSTKAYFVQAITWLVIQSGNYNPATGLGELPLFWNGTNLARSNGITGALTNGVISGNNILVSVSGNFTIATAGNTFIVPNVAAYAGNQYDKVTVKTVAGTALGTFEVMVTGADAMVLKTITTTVSGTTYGFADSPLTFTYTNLVGNTQNVIVATNTFLYIGSLTVYIGPGTGQFQQLSLAAQKSGAAFLYPGKTGDIIALWDGTTYLGTWKISLITPGTLYIEAVAPVSGTTIQPNDTVKWTVVLGFNDGNYLYAPPVPAQPSVFTVVVPFTSATPDAYNGNVGDTITITDSVGNNYGTYAVGYTGSLPSWQAGVGVTLIVRSGAGTEGKIFPLNFIITINSVPSFSTSNINQIPSATAMAFFQGRIFYATGNTVNGGDIEGGPSGTLANNYKDSVLCVTENPLCFGGDGFTMPSGSDNITGLAIPQMINASLGQGLLNIFTANSVFALQVPVTRADWIAANSTNQPQVFVVQQGAGTGSCNDTGIVPINGDLWYTRSDGNIQSLLTAVRYFQQWANVDVSSNENYLLDTINRDLLGTVGGIFFSNYYLSLTSPVTTPYGVVFKAIVPLDLESISTLEEQLPPAWEGQYEGLQIFALTVATFVSTQRAFATTLSTETAGQIELCELIPEIVGDTGNRIQWQFLTPSMTFSEHGWETELKRLVSAELWLDSIKGVVDIEVEYIPDGSSCPCKWTRFSVCNATDSSQLTPSQGYPLIPFSPGKRRPLVLPLPPDANDDEDGRPANVAFEFQTIVTIKGECRVRGWFLKAEKVERPLYENMIP